RTNWDPFGGPQQVGNRLRFGPPLPWGLVLNLRCAALHLKSDGQAYVRYPGFDIHRRHHGVVQRVRSVPIGVGTVHIGYIEVPFIGPEPKSETKSLRIVNVLQRRRIHKYTTPDTECIDGILSTYPNIERSTHVIINLP